MSHASEDSDLRLLAAPMVVKLAAAISGIAGLFACLGGLQPATSLIFRELWPRLLVWSLVFGGAGQVVMAFLLVRNREWVAIAASVFAPLMLVMSAMWLFFALANGAFGCPNILAIPLGLAAAILSPMSIGPARQASAARRRLSDQGIELGL